MRHWMFSSSCFSHFSFRPKKIWIVCLVLFFWDNIGRSICTTRFEYIFLARVLIVNSWLDLKRREKVQGKERERREEREKERERRERERRERNTREKIRLRFWRSLSLLLSHILSVLFHTKCFFLFILIIWSVETHMQCLKNGTRQLLKLNYQLL